MTSPVHTVANTWEANRDLLSRKTNTWKNKADNPSISSYTYTVNNLGQRTAVSTTGDAFAQSPADWTWTYDALGQITGANTDQYTYDQIGNRLTSGKQNGAQTDYTAVHTTEPAYDADGNQLTGLTATAALPDRNTLTFTWNANNRPVEIKQKGEPKETRIYDHLGHRIRKGDTLTLYDRYNAIAEYNLNTQALKATYAWGNDLSGSPQGAGGVGGLLSITEHDKQTPLVSYPCYDGNGNISEYLTEENGGTLVAHYEYDAFGNVTKKTGEKEYSYQFSTKLYDTLTGLNYYSYRDYDPVNGRWINRDPIEENGGINLYGFINNDSIKYYDIVGLDVNCPTTSNEYGHTWEVVSKPGEDMPQNGAWSEWKRISIYVGQHTWYSPGYERSRINIIHGLKSTGSSYEAPKGEEIDYSYSLTLENQTSIDLGLGKGIISGGIDFTVSKGSARGISGKMGEKGGKYAYYVEAIVRYTDVQKNIQSKTSLTSDKVEDGFSKTRLYKSLTIIKCKRCECKKCD